MKISEKLLPKSISFYSVSPGSIVRDEIDAMEYGGLVHLNTCFEDPDTGELIHRQMSLSSIEAQELATCLTRAAVNAENFMGGES